MPEARKNRGGGLILHGEVGNPEKKKAEFEARRLNGKERGATRPSTGVGEGVAVGTSLPKFPNPQLPEFTWAGEAPRGCPPHLFILLEYNKLYLTKNSWGRKPRIFGLFSGLGGKKTTTHSHRLKRRQTSLQTPMQTVK